ncbi:MAG: hypothetical protein AUJ31_00970 [Parcubacteria group bacterium CG1_02_39_15]|uniref:Dienelactone hydrolase domain-containing protein n=2 Tax=Bacteria candidate phyla TaxID=1783234 RepID=A0A2M7UVE6_9BACT|nr:MAG: hypothetical protein AUJ31_00970 [Parcubacteria group bacterium CG1_02_39_15]PIZ87932.1 MAG: hypothetical protein COX91_02920 [Candidatus Nealsonbacteria bacterium CG_4_10_14_0_2_um_filter_39_15]
MKKIKIFTLTFAVLTSLFFLFGLEIVPEHLQIQRILDSAVPNDVIIIFNSGGWGDTPLEKAEDFAPIVKEIQETLNDWGYNSIVIPYNRTKNNLAGKLAGTKDFLNSFDSSSEILAEDLERLTAGLPDKKIIIAGLSNGGAFARETMEKISDDAKNSIYAISVGVPFWYGDSQPGNMLQLTNRGRDSLSAGEVRDLLLSLIETPFRWIYSKVNGDDLAFAQAFQVPGHAYSWSSDMVGPQIVNFLEAKLQNISKKE